MSGALVGSAFNPGGHRLVTDAARRCSDTITTHLLADPDHARGCWVAIRLSDGGSDGVLYDRRRHAVLRQLHESQCAYIRIPWGGMTAVEAQAYLDFCRAAYDAGMRMTDPDGPELVMPSRAEAFRAPRRGFRRI